MKKIIFLSLVLVSFLTSAQKNITRNISDFSEVKIYNGIAVELIKSTEQKLEISGEKSEKVKVKQVNNILKISLNFPETLAKDKVKIKLYYNKEIKTIDANEAAVITGKDINQSQLEVKVQEGAFVNLVVNTKHLKVKSSSGGIIKLSGSTKNQEVNVDLGGIYHGYNLKVSDLCTVKAGSGAKAEVTSGETLDAKVSFGGSIYYKGKPDILKDKKVIGGVIEHRS